MDATLFLSLFFLAVIALIIRSYFRQTPEQKQTPGRLYGTKYTGNPVYIVEPPNFTKRD